jgi:hypothetical protein
VAGHALLGHTVGFRAIVVATADGTYCGSGDAVVTYETFERGLPPGVHTDVDQAMRAGQTVRELASRALRPPDYSLLGEERLRRLPQPSGP